MLGAGTVINPILKIVTTVAVLAATYFFIIEPILDTTENAISEGSKQAERAQREAAERSEQIQIDVLETRIESSLPSLASSWPQAAREIRDCARKAGRDRQALERCLRLQQTVSGMQSNRNVSLSYADSVAAQGNSAGAAQIERCVADAGFKPGAMSRCRELADDLLFG
jgi:hypothetical protein